MLSNRKCGNSIAEIVGQVPQACRAARVAVERWVAPLTPLLSQLNNKTVVPPRAVPPCVVTNVSLIT